LPFGEEIPVGVNGRTGPCYETLGSGGLSPTGPEYPAAADVAAQKFTGKERDAETGLDYFDARYFSSAQGRFTSPDWSGVPQPVPYANLGDPQTLDLYAYVRNNPLGQADADGHCCFFENLATVAKQSYTVVASGAALMGQGAKMGASTIAQGLNLVGGALSENPNFSISNISTADLNNIGKNVTLGLATDGLGETGAARVLSEEGTVTRYMGPGEAAVALKTGEIPNTNAAGEFRPTHVTTDAPLNSAAQAQSTYELPSTPTHQATVPAGRVTDLQGTPDGRATTSGGGSQAATHNPIPVKPEEVRKLNP
jgi:RHS repeat-associated protein